MTHTRATDGLHVTSMNSIVYIRIKNIVATYVGIAVTLFLVGNPLFDIRINVRIIKISRYGGKIMITYVIGDLLKSPADVLVNTVNTVGVMGKGIANDFKKIYPEMFTQYQKLCEKGLFNIGQLWIFKTKNKWVLNFPTKKHWRNPSKIEYIEAGLDKFVKTYAEKGITSISFPMLGCGNGELNWETEVRPLMEKYLKNIPIDIYILNYS